MACDSIESSRAATSSRRLARSSATSASPVRRSPPSAPRSTAKGAQVIDARGHHVIPGVLDVHVHLELPFCGTVSADDYRTGTRAGARGGVTTVIDFAIPYAGESLGQAADNWLKKAEGKSLIDYTFHICITRWNDHKDQIKEMVDRGLHHLQGVHDLRVRGVAVGRPRDVRHAGEDEGVRDDAARARRVGARARRADRAIPHAGADEKVRRAPASR